MLKNTLSTLIAIRGKLYLTWVLKTLPFIKGCNRRGATNSVGNHITETTSGKENVTSSLLQYKGFNPNNFI